MSPSPIPTDNLTTAPAKPPPPPTAAPQDSAKEDTPSTNDQPDEGTPSDAESKEAVEASEDAADGSEQPPAKPDPWQAVFSPEANAWYFWNSETQATQWTNPRDPDSATAEASVPTEEAPVASGLNGDGLPEIDPDLAWLDPAAAARSRGGNKAAAGVAQTARFNARTGRFQADPAMNPDRISDYQRSNRQQEAYFDVAGWEAQLEGRGIKRGATSSAAAAAAEDPNKKRPSSKEVNKFRQQKEDKKRAKLQTWLGS